jgi:hypothetical protein
MLVGGISAIHHLSIQTFCSVGREDREGSMSSQHVYEARPRKDHRGVDLISDALPFGRLWYTQISHAIGYAESSAGAAR